LENRSAEATSGEKTCFDAGKIGFCHCAAVLQTQVPKLCTDLDLSLLYISILRTYSKFAWKFYFLALGVYCPAGQSAFRRSWPQLKLGYEIESSRLVDDSSRKNHPYPTPPWRRKRKLMFYIYWFVHTYWFLLVSNYVCSWSSLTKYVENAAARSGSWFKWVDRGGVVILWKIFWHIFWRGQLREIFVWKTRPFREILIQRKGRGQAGGGVFWTCVITTILLMVT